MVTILRALGEQLEDDRVGGRRDALVEMGGWERYHGDVRMSPLEWVARLERKPTGEQLVKHDPEGVEIGSPVNGPVHAPRLLWGHVLGAALHGPRGAVDTHERRAPKPRQPHAAIVEDDDEMGLHVEMDDTATMHLGKCPCEPGAQRESARRLAIAACDPLQESRPT